MSDEHPTMIWRSAGPDDYPMIGRAQLETFRITHGRDADPGDVEHMRQRTRAALDQPEKHRLETLYDGDRAVAYFWLDLASVSNARLLDIHVIPAMRGKGIGRSVMSRILSVLRERSIPRFTLTVSVNNQAACALYESYGATPSERTGDMVVLSLPVPDATSD